MTPGQESNPRPLDRKSDALIAAPQDTVGLISLLIFDEFYFIHISHSVIPRRTGENPSNKNNETFGRVCCLRALRVTTSTNVFTFFSASTDH